MVEVERSIQKLTTETIIRENNLQPVDFIRNRVSTEISKVLGESRYNYTSPQIEFIAQGLAGTVKINNSNPHIPYWRLLAMFNDPMSAEQSLSRELISSCKSNEPSRHSCFNVNPKEESSSSNIQYYTDQYGVTYLNLDAVLMCLSAADKQREFCAFYFPSNLFKSNVTH